MIDQVDSDGDEMPDEYEVRSGLDMTTDDSVADPDNDGMPNLAEFKLHTNPHASDNPLNLSVTNGTRVSGFVQLPLVKLNPVIDKQPIGLYVNGDPAANSFFSQGPDGQWLLNWDTGFLTNGNYSIYAGFRYKPEVPLSDASTFFGRTNTVVVTNVITFDELTSQFTDYLVIDAKLAVQNASCRVDLYDEDGTPLVYGVFATTNGLVQAYWDLTDGNGNQLAFGNINTSFRVAAFGTTNFSSTDPVMHWFLKEAHGSGGDFVVAWGWDVYTTGFNNRRNDAMLNGVINLLGNPADPSAYNLRPAANVAYANTFRYDTIADGDLLLNELASPNAGNFFWFGHAGKDSIAGNYKKTSIDSDGVEGVLGNKAHRSTPRVPRTNKHPYKFVVLNGCETYSSDWANAFGIDFSPQGSSTLTPTYLSAGRTPRAFVGWTKQIDVPNRLGSWVGYETEYAEGLGQLFYNWMQGSFLTYSLNQYATTMTSHGFANHDSWKISGCANLTRAD